MSIHKHGEREEECFDASDDGENIFTEAIEIPIESNEWHKVKSAGKKNKRNEHRKTKKRKHKNTSEEDNSSDDNLMSIKVRQEMTYNAKVEKKTKKKKDKSAHSEDNNGTNNIHIKQEVFSDDNEKLSESDEDVPLSLLEKEPQKHHKKKKKVNVRLKVKKKYEITSNADVIEEEGKVKKLRIKKIKVEDDDFMPTTCVECNKSFSDNLKYKAHMRKVHSQKPFVCVVCSKAFSKERDLLNHHNTHTGQNPYSCEQCGKLFKSDGTLKKHTRIFHADSIKKYACTMCPKVLSSASCLEEHERLHTGENPWSCNLCGKLFARERDLKLHANLHEELWKCDVCQRCFITSFKLKEHYRSHTGETPYGCDKCDRKFSRLADFRYHVGTHLGLKPFSCDLCGMKFTTSSSMKRHLLNMHQQGPLDFKCHICSKGFHTQTRLNSHVKNHENKRKYTCHICNATRSSQSELQRHLILHSGEFRCDTCNRSCSSAERLAAHVAKHDLTGKPYACFVCSLGYQSSQSLNKHLATVHKDEDVPKVSPQHLCTLCGMVFDHKDKLNRHLKDDHIVLGVGEIHSIIEDELYSQKSCDELGNTTHLKHSSDNVTMEIPAKVTQIQYVQDDNGLATKVMKSPTKKVANKSTKHSILSNHSDKVLEKESHNNNEESGNLNFPESPTKNLKNNSQLKSEKAEVSNKAFLPVEKNTPISNPVLEKSKFKEFTHKCNVENTSNPLTIIKSETNALKAEYSSPPLEKIDHSNIPQNPVEIIQKLARKNVEDFLHKEQSKNTLEPLINPMHTTNNHEVTCKSKSQEQDHPRTKSLDEKGTPLPPHSRDMSKELSEVPAINIVKTSTPMPSGSQLYTECLSQREHVITKQESENILQEHVAGVEVEPKMSNIQEASKFLGSSVSIPPMPNYFDDLRVKDLSTSSIDGKYAKESQKYHMYENMYSKTPSNQSMSSISHIKPICQSSYKSINDSFDNYNQILQSGMQQSSNSWFLPNKLSSISEGESILKHNLFKNLPESKQRDVKASGSESFHNDQYIVKTQVEPKYDTSSLSLPNTPPTLHKDKYYDSKIMYPTNSLDFKNYFDDFTQKQYLQDDKRRSSNSHSVSYQVTNSKPSIRGYQAVPSHFTNEHDASSSMSIRDHFTTPDQLNIYNSHPFSTVPNSSHIFQNFRDLQHRMMNSSIPAYTHHSKHHFLPAIDSNTQKMMSPSSSSGYSHVNVQSHMSNVSSIPQHKYDLSINTNNSLSYQGKRSPRNNRDGDQGKDDSSSPYELRVAAN